MSDGRPSTSLTGSSLDDYIVARAGDLHHTVFVITDMMICMYIHTIWFSSFVCFKHLIGFVYVCLCASVSALRANGRAIA